jgi:hypothetical protein
MAVLPDTAEEGSHPNTGRVVATYLQVCMTAAALSGSLVSTRSTAVAVLANRTLDAAGLKHTELMVGSSVLVWLERSRLNASRPSWMLCKHRVPACEHN